MKRMISCALGATLGLLSSVAAADTAPVPPPPPATPVVPVPAWRPSLPSPGPAVPAPVPAPVPASAADQLMPPNGFVGGVHAGGAGPAAHSSLLDVWMKYYDVPPRNAFAAETLIWWVKAAATPPLAQATPPSLNGFRPNGGILVGGEDLDEQQRYGVRLSYTRWFDRCATTGFEARAFVLGDRHAYVGISSFEFPDLSRPFVSNNPGLEGALGKPVFVSGSVQGLFSTELDSEFYGDEFNFRRRVYQNGSSRVDGLVGFRHLHLNERVTLTETTNRVADSGAFPDELAGSRAVVFDRFSTENDFFGAQLGVNVEYRCCEKWAFDLRTMLAVGATHERVSVEGSQTRFLTDGTILNLNGGFLALDSNIGTQTRNSFAVVPQISGHVSYYPLPGLRLFGGYDFLYWSRVARVGEQIDITLDATRIPRFAPEGAVNPAEVVRPAPLFKNNHFWAQGVSFGAELRW